MKKITAAREHKCDKCGKKTKEYFYTDGNYIYCTECGGKSK